MDTASHPGFVNRSRRDGREEAICLQCFRTIGPALAMDALDELEKAHRCEGDTGLARPDYASLRPETPQDGKVGEMTQRVGTVKWFDNAMGYGFIGRSDGPDIFVHYSAIKNESYRCLKEGDMVAFDLIDEPAGSLHASNVIRLARPYSRS